MQNKEKNFVSCVIYLHNDARTVKGYLEKVGKLMQERFEQYEIICVNDGCTDNTLEKLQEYVQEAESKHILSLINLSYYQGVEAAMNAGRDLAVGDFLFEFDSCIMDFDLALIMQVYYRALEGYDVVAASPKHYVSFTSKLFYQVFNMGSHSKNRLRQERFRIISRRAINRVNQLNTYIPYRKALYANCGLKMDTLAYDNSKYDHKSRKKEERGTRNVLALDTLIIFTDILERLSLLLSVLFFAVLLLVFADIIFSIFSNSKPVEGWLSLMAVMSFGFFMLFIMLTLIFKYLSVILNVSFKRQRYVIEGVEKLTK